MILEQQKRGLKKQKVDQLFKQLELVREDLNEVYELYDQNLDKHRDLDKIADMYFQQAIVSQHLGETEEALFLYDQIQQIYEKQEDQSNLGVILNNIGNIYYHLKKFYKSERYHQKALKVRKKLKSKQEMVQSYQNLGNIYIEMGDKAKYELRPNGIGTIIS
ncbi:hypothetical protein PPERSA_09572 [Pseudocohnilembus persalinus]|uniref:Uncharacterized protein n=1 Tax=Pseudocohnilembus persalinus TaxID=266149 RepID=A0A0V0QFI4_PSEPJ|nr:hypothetical protein PPERSA_09572 [Pseudocohnilembus persalinus]|eukprot:KRX00966.1 hypothetical protein PPERSA_09572 [Pseudocohnilembus persalinus]